MRLLGFGYLLSEMGDEGKWSGDLPCLLVNTGSVKFSCHLCKGIEKRFEWQWPQVTITEHVMADSQLRSSCLVDFEMRSLNSLKFQNYPVSSLSPPAAHTQISMTLPVHMPVPAALTELFPFPRASFQCPIWMHHTLWFTSMCWKS